MNLFRGRLSDREQYFHIPDRGFRKPDHLSEEGPTLLPGSDYGLTFRFRSRRFEFLLNGLSRYERRIQISRRSGRIELRTQIPHRYDRIVIEGRLHSDGGIPPRADDR
jgi:hypothetical protein